MPLNSLYPKIFCLLIIAISSLSCAVSQRQVKFANVVEKDVVDLLPTDTAVSFVNSALKGTGQTADASGMNLRSNTNGKIFHTPYSKIVIAAGSISRTPPSLTNAKPRSSVNNYVAITGLGSMGKGDGRCRIIQFFQIENLDIRAQSKLLNALSSLGASEWMAGSITCN